MKLLWEKLSRYWQLRFLAMGAGVALIVYAVLLPDPGNYNGTSILSVAAAPRMSATDTSDSQIPVPTSSGNTTAASEATPAGIKMPWLGENHAAADQLHLAAEGYQDADLPRDFSESIRKLRNAANQGNAVAELLLGHAYQLGLGVPKDMTETARWYA